MSADTSHVLEGGSRDVHLLLLRGGGGDRDLVEDATGLLSFTSDICCTVSSLCCPLKGPLGFLETCCSGLKSRGEERARGCECGNESEKEKQKQ